MWSARPAPAVLLSTTATSAPRPEVGLRLRGMRHPGPRVARRRTPLGAGRAPRPAGVRAGPVGAVTDAWTAGSAERSRGRDRPLATHLPRGDSARPPPPHTPIPRTSDSAPAWWGRLRRPAPRHTPIPRTSDSAPARPRSRWMRPRRNGVPDRVARRTETTHAAARSSASGPENRRRQPRKALHRVRGLAAWRAAPRSARRTTVRGRQLRRPFFCARLRRLHHVRQRLGQLPPHLGGGQLLTQCRVLGFQGL